MQKKRIIIVGQGIAGTVLAATLMERDCRITIIDDPSLSHASRVAAGLVNPIVFKRLVKSWKADELIREMRDFYEKAEERLGIRCYHPKKIVKLFAEPQEIELWNNKKTEETGKYLGSVFPPGYLEELIHNPLGAAEVNGGGNLDTALFLSAYRRFFKEQGLLLEEQFDHEAVSFLQAGISYKSMEADLLIFCEGYRCLSNPWFSGLPFKLTKGETLTIRLRSGMEIPEEQVINKGAFILPLGNNIYKVGATYEWNELNEETTEKGKKELCDKLDRILKVDYEVIGHQAGIRPTVNDRRPLIGIHPEHPFLAVFNGMGTKAVMLAPYFARQFSGLLLDGMPVDPEANIARFA